VVAGERSPTSRKSVHSNLTASVMEVAVDVDNLVSTPLEVI
jgi:hypothetical protein